MASCCISVNSVFLHLLIFISSLLTVEVEVEGKPVSLSFPLTSVPLYNYNSNYNYILSSRRLSTSSHYNQNPGGGAASSPLFNYSSKTPFNYSMALIVSLPIGTPPQLQRMVVDTGSQLSWIQCHHHPNKNKSPQNQNQNQNPKPPPTTSFDPSLSSSFSLLPCDHPVCKPRIPDFTIPTTCDQNRICHYSYYYADGTLAEGNLVREKFAFSGSRSTPPLILGCAAESSEAEGILGMNLGRLSFVSQAKVPTFSYCVPIRVRQGTRARARDDSNNNNPTGNFYLGPNPNSHTFRYTNLLTFPDQSQRMPNFDYLAYTVGMTGIKIGGRKLNIPESSFRPDAGGSGQTIIDSGTQYTFLVSDAYAKVREEVVRLAGTKLKKGYVYGGALDMCFDGNATEIGRLVGGMVFQFEDRVEISVGRERIMDHVGGGVHCIAIGRSESLGVPSNIIGNFHQQNLWVEFDLIKRRIGFGVADCSRSMY